MLAATTAQHLGIIALAALTVMPLAIVVRLLLIFLWDSDRVALGLMFGVAWAFLAGGATILHVTADSDRLGKVALLVGGLTGMLTVHRFRLVRTPDD